MINIPPKFARSENHQPNLGKFVGVTEFLRGLKLGESTECPRQWESALCTASKHIGIRVATRRRGKPDSVTVYRIE